MKKLLLACSFLGIGMQTTFAQWNENFNSGIPAGWTLFNVDGLTPAANVNFVNNAWVSRDRTTTGDKCIVSTSWYSPAGTADDWITSPSFVVPSGNPYLLWEEYAPDSQFPDGYEVRLSTTGNTTADFTTTLYSTPAAGSNGFSFKSASLNAYIGQSVRIAFRNNSNDKFLLYLDNIQVTNLAAGADASVTGVNLNAIMGSTDKVGFTLRNEGASAITSVTASYTIDGGAPVVQNFTSLNLGTFNSTDLQFTTPVGAQSAGNHNVAIAITQVNGGADPNAANNNGSGAFIAPTGSEQRNCLIEEFTSSTCVPCANFNVTFDPLILSQNANDNGSNFNIIKYQMNWPAPGNDVSYNPDGAARQNYYGVNAIPDHLTNGQTGGNGDAAEISACKTPVSFVSMTGSYLVKGGSVDSVEVSVTLTPRFTISGGNYSLRVALIEDHYTNNGATTTQKEYYHVMRKMLPDANGTSIANLTAGTPQTFTFKYKYNEGGVAQGNYNFWGDPAGGHMVAFLQDEDNGDVMQSVAVRGQHPASVNNVLMGVQNAMVYPNPASSVAYFKFNLAETQDITVTVLDMTGRVISQPFNGQMNVGEQSVTINTSHLATGLYQVKITTDKGELTQRLNVAK